MSKADYGRRALAGKRIALSISDSADLTERGLSDEHLRDAMVEIARHLLSQGASLLYGGDLRQLGFTEILAELVARYRELVAKSVPLFTNYLAWPVHIRFDSDRLKSVIDEFGQGGELIFLDLNGNPIPTDVRLEMTAKIPSGTDWELGLTSMRVAVTSRCDARIALGGRTEDYQGRLPGVVEEVALAVDFLKPVYLIGGFGGAARWLAELRFDDESVNGGNRRPFATRFDSSTRQFPGWRSGLEKVDEARLVHTVHIDEIVTLLLRGLHKTLGTRSPD